MRIALHTGEARTRRRLLRPCSQQNRVARLRALAQGGVTVVSQATAEIVHDRLPPAVELVALGRHELRGLSRPENVFELRPLAAGAATAPSPTRARDAQDGHRVVLQCGRLGAGREARSRGARAGLLPLPPRHACRSGTARRHGRGVPQRRVDGGVRRTAPARRRRHQGRAGGRRDAWGAAAARRRLRGPGGGATDRPHRHRDRRGPRRPSGDRPAGRGRRGGQCRQAPGGTGRPRRDPHRRGDAPPSAERRAGRARPGSNLAERRPDRAVLRLVEVRPGAPGACPASTRRSSAATGSWRPSRPSSRPRSATDLPSGDGARRGGRGQVAPRPGVHRRPR